MRRKNVLGLNDTVLDAIVKMSEGNPGGMNVLVELLQHGKKWHGLDGIMLVLHLDKMGVYGSNLWLLYSDCCKRDINLVERVLRAHQLGIISEEDVWNHIENSIPFTDLKTVPEMLEDMTAEG